MERKGTKIQQRSKELRPLHKQFLVESIKNPGVEFVKIFSDLHRLNYGTVYGWYKRSLKRETREAKREELIKRRRKEEVVSPTAVAYALLMKVVEILTEYEELVKLRSRFRELQKDYSNSSSTIRKLEGEIERILKLHNEQVKTGKLTDSATLLRLAGIKLDKVKEEP